MKKLLLFLLTGCSVDAFVSFEGGITFESGITIGDGGADAADDDSGDASKSDSGKDVVQPDGGIEASDASCTSGTKGCEDGWATYCSRLKSCCAGQCPWTWANNGGSECREHFTGVNWTTWCASNRSGDMRCVEQCNADIQSASCTTIKQGTGPWTVSSACNAFWQ